MNAVAPAARSAKAERDTRADLARVTDAPPAGRPPVSSPMFILHGRARGRAGLLRALGASLNASRPPHGGLGLCAPFFEPRLEWIEVSGVSCTGSLGGRLIARVSTR